MDFVDKKAKLSSLWIFVFLNMIFRDLHQFGNVDFVEGMITGVVDGVQITEGLMLIGGIMIAVPLLMVPLTQFLNFRANRLANLFIGVLQFVVIIGVNMAPDLDDIFFAVIELTALVLIVGLAWKWKEPAA
jgi:predicted tellurium resistance membrane protein TerC